MQTSSPAPCLTADGCRARQERLRRRLAERGLEAAVLTDYREVYYFTGTLLSANLPVVLFLPASGRSWVVAGSAPVGGVDETLAYEWNLQGTNHFGPLGRLNEVLARHLSGAKRVGRIGFQGEALPQQIATTLTRCLNPVEWVAIDADLRALQRPKDADELKVMRAVIRANLSAYDAARAALAAGVTELEVLAAGWRGATLAAGEKVFHDGDYQCGSYNGPARPRRLEAGELYIIDAWTCYRGYWSDLSRTFLVSAEPTELQQSLFDQVRCVQTETAAMLKPGAHTSDIWRAMDARLREHPALADTGLIHHGGHGIGLRIHGEPDINRDRGDRLLAGDVVCLEPGGYTAKARHGVRLENTYLITQAGAVNLSEYPFDLAAGPGSQTREKPKSRPARAVCNVEVTT